MTIFDNFSISNLKILPQLVFYMDLNYVILKCIKSYAFPINTHICFIKGIK